jgi:S1-C subfamily serine protease
VQGQVVGIPPLGVTDATGLGFTINSNQASTIAKQIIQSGGS